MEGKKGRGNYLRRFFTGSFPCIAKLRWRPYISVDVKQDLMRKLIVLYLMKIEFDRIKVDFRVPSVIMRYFETEKSQENGKAELLCKHVDFLDQNHRRARVLQS